MRVFAQSVLPCDAERAWAAVRTSALLVDVCWPMMTFLSMSGEAFSEAVAGRFDGAVANLLVVDCAAGGAIADV